MTVSLCQCHKVHLAMMSSMMLTHHPQHPVPDRGQWVWPECGRKIRFWSATKDCYWGGGGGYGGKGHGGWVFKGAVRREDSRK